MTKSNPIQDLSAIVNWYNWQHVSMHSGLKSTRDAIKLYRYARLKSNHELVEFADEWPASERIKALGYDPMNTNPDIAKRLSAIDVAYKRAMQNAAGGSLSLNDKIRLHREAKAERQAAMDDLHESIKGTQP